jgi:hypothetical protein
MTLASVRKLALLLASSRTEDEEDLGVVILPTWDQAGGIFEV